MFFLCIILFSYIGFFQKTVPTITYFPPDESVHFDEANNSLSYENNTLYWQSTSTTNKRTYLRQDLSLLFVNGYFKGFMNSWKRNEETIEFKEIINDPSPGLYTSISYHYGETQTDKHIRSQASMSSSALLLDCTNDPCVSLEPHTNMSPTIDQETALLTDLHRHWQQLADHFQIDITQFDQIALTDLVKYRDEPLPPYTQEKTDEIINHLWEGLYANYFVVLMETPEEEGNHMMPLLLYAKDELYILYELHGKKEQLIQRISY